jgi:hypothetical protein
MQRAPVLATIGTTVSRWQWSTCACVEMTASAAVIRAGSIGIGTLR